jgi:cytochrome c biogenesis protein CcmG/thiol:disulfide interchange protein DsbE
VKRSLLFILVIIVAITVALFVGKSYTKGGKGAPSVIASVLKPQDDGPANGTPAPDFTLKTLDGKDVTLSSLKGKAVMVNFWATWCEPCKIEMPWMVELQDKYRKDGFEIVGVAMDDSDNKEIAAFAKKMNVNYTILKGSEKVADLYGGLDGLPTNFFLDRNGKVIDSFKGLRSESVIVADIQKALASETKNAALTR